MQPELPSTYQRLAAFIAPWCLRALALSSPAWYLFPERV